MKLQHHQFNAIIYLLMKYELFNGNIYQFRSSTDIHSNISKENRL